MPQNVDFQARSEGLPVNRRGAGRWLATHRSRFRRLVLELDGIFLQFHQLVSVPNCEESDEVRAHLGALKRTVSERLPTLLQQIGPALIELEFWRPGISSGFYEIVLHPPSLLQGPTTWLQHLGQLRGLLLQAIGQDLERANQPAISVQSNRVALEPSSPQVPVRAAGENRGTEPHFTPKELAELWGLDQSTVRRLFHDEEGVLRIPHLRRRGKRDYVSLRIPATVAARVHERRSRSLFKV